VLWPLYVSPATYNNWINFNPMKILICNDDGYQAPGLTALYESLKTVADVEVVAPEINNSAKSNALTLHAPLYVETSINGFRFVNGTPADCVHIALKGLLGYLPDQQRCQYG
jgi:5'-nucleotidase